MIKDLISQNRSYRRFHEHNPVDRRILEDMVDLARKSPSAGNKQPLKYLLSCSKDLNEKIFPNLAWAGYLKDWNGPVQGERPAAYIIILGDRNISENFYCDHGIASQSMLLGAVEKGLGGCIIGSINRKELRKVLNIGDRFEILLVLALGEPKEKVVLEDVKNEDITYWRDEKDVHHVPKRSLNDLILDL